jgi:hypothetical protein
MPKVMVKKGGRKDRRCSRARAPFQARHYFFAFPHKVDRFINRRGIIGLVGFAITTSLIRVPLDRFRVGLMAEIPARENFKNTKTSKTFQISLVPREKLLGRAGLVL